MEKSLVICDECGSKYTRLYYLRKTDEFYCEACNGVFSRRDIFSFSWAENIIDGMNIDQQMENIVQESVENLHHEIIMEKIFEKKAQKADIKAVLSKADELLEEIFAL